MAELTERTYYLISPADLADWLDAQPGTWWFVDGDRDLTAELDFPCPNDEIAAALREQRRPLLVLDRNPASQAHGEHIAGPAFERLAERDDRYGNRHFVMQWAGSDTPWLLSEDREASDGSGA